MLKLNVIWRFFIKVYYGLRIFEVQSSEVRPTDGKPKSRDSILLRM